VLDVVARHGYLPKSLVDPTQLYAAKTIRFLAFATDDVVSEGYGEAPFFAQVLQGIEAESRRLGYELTFSTLRSYGDFDSIAARNVSYGYLLLGTNVSEALVREIVRREPATIVLDTDFDYIDANFVMLDNTSGAYTAAEYLLALGHERIGYVHGSTRIQNFEHRRRGFDAALRRRGLELREEDLVGVPSDAELAEQAFERHLRERQAPLPSALFCENDYIAMGVMKALRATGIEVPARVSVMGFDNVPRSAVVEPPLTTMNVDKHAMGAIAVRRLVEVVEAGGVAHATKVSIVTRLVERGSCAPPGPQASSSRDAHAAAPA
jgi:DNA-binding LacI/PurR family transcriptional regulator